MTVTRDADVPAEVGHLFQAFNRACEGHDAETVLSAAVNMVVAAINYIERGSPGGSKAGATQQAETIARQISPLVQAQWDRQSLTSDMTIPLNGN